MNSNAMLSLPGRLLARLAVPVLAVSPSCFGAWTSFSLIFGIHFPSISRFQPSNSVHHQFGTSTRDELQDETGYHFTLTPSFSTHHGACMLR